MLYLYRKHRKNRKKNNRRFWIRRLYDERSTKGEYEMLLSDLRLHDHEMFFRYFRKLPETFDFFFKFIINKDLR